MARRRPDERVKLVVEIRHKKLLIAVEHHTLGECKEDEIREAISGILQEMDPDMMPSDLLTVSSHVVRQGGKPSHHQITTVLGEKIGNPAVSKRLAAGIWNALRDVETEPLGEQMDHAAGRIFEVAESAIRNYKTAKGLITTVGVMTGKASPAGLMTAVQDMAAGNDDISGLIGSLAPMLQEPGGIGKLLGELQGGAEGDKEMGGLSSILGLLGQFIK